MVAGVLAFFAAERRRRRPVLAHAGGGAPLLGALLWLALAVPAALAQPGGPGAAPATPQPAAGGGPSLREMAGQLLLIGFRGLEARPDDAIVQDVRARRVGGVILFDFDLPSQSGVRNIESPDQVARLTGQLRETARQAGGPPLFIAVDVEGGRVNRLKPKFGFPDLPSAAALGRQDLSAVRQAGDLVGRTLAGVGVNLDFAPVLDVNVNPDNPVIGKLERSFSGQPDAVAVRGLAFAEGLRGRGVLTAVKHFPGHGSSRQDSHLGVTDISWTWTEAELKPFRHAIHAGLADMVMTGHLFNEFLDPDHPATLSRRVITNLLRRDLGFQGVVVSDDMQMKAITSQYGLERAIELALNAGVDILLFGNNLDYDPDIARKALAIMERLVEEGRVPRERVREAYDRVVALKAKLS